MIDFGFDLAGIREPRLRRGLVWSSLGALLEATPLLVAYGVVRALLAGADSPLGPVGLAALLAGLLAATFAAKAAGGRLSFSATYNLVSQTRLRLLEHLRRLPMGYWSQRRLGSVASTLTDEFALYTEIATHAWGLVVANVALPIGMACVLVLADWRLALLVLSPVPVAMLALPWSVRLVQRAADGARGHKRAAVASIVEYVHGIETLRDLDADETYREEIERRLHSLERAMMRAELLPSPAILTYSLLVMSGFVLVFLFGSFWVERGEVPPAHFFVVLVLALHFARTLSELVIYVAMARHAGRTLEQIRQLFEVPVQPEGDEGHPHARPHLSVEEVSFAYEEQPTLDAVSAAFEPGTLTALVGPSGSGKSTLAHLLTRLWDVDEGAVRIDGVDVREMRLSRLHELTATVFQDVVLFQDTVLENLRLGRPDATRAEVESAARTARAHNFIEALPQGYDTVLGPGGRDLSGGQRQRISIARALLKDAPILILDEATASVDLDEERRIQEALGALMRGRTVVVVAHRLWTVQGADQILVLRDGAIVERGTHAELIDERGLYREMWDRQRANREWRLVGPAHTRGTQSCDCE